VKFKFRPLQLLPLFIWLLPFFTQSVQAEIQQGLNAVGYKINQINPTRSDTAYPTCGTETENNINRNFEGEPFQQCTTDMFMIHYTGYIEIPTNNTIKFMVAADDGGTVKIGTTEFGTWNLKGCSWSAQTTNSFPAGSYPLDGWFYEWGGGSCYMLAWNIDNTGWQIVPDSAFTQQAVATTTTSSTTTSSTTTTLSSTTTSTTTTEVSTTTSSSTTTLPTTTTTTSEPVQTSTTTSIENTTTSTTTTVQVSPTTTQAPYTPPQTTTTSPTIETQPQPTTTEPDTTVDEPDTTEPETSTTDLPDPVEDTVEPVETTIPETVVPDRVDEILPDETEQPEDISEPQEDIKETEVEQVDDSSSTTLPPISEIESVFDVDISKEELTEILDKVFADTTDTEQVVEAINDLLDADLSKEELAAVFDAVFDEDLSDEETIELAQEVLKGELDAEEFGTVLDAIFDKVVTDEVLIETFTAVLETKLDAEKFEAIVNVLESDVISKEQVAEVVTLIIEQEGGVNAEQATELATSEKVLESIDGDQATEVFDAVVASEVSPEDGLAISKAVQEAPKEVRKAFEKELNVFEGVFDVYVPMGSRIPVGDRRVIVGVGAVLLSVPVRVRVG